MGVRLRWINTGKPSSDTSCAIGLLQATFTFGFCAFRARLLSALKVGASSPVCWHDAAPGVGDLK